MITSYIKVSINSYKEKRRRKKKENEDFFLTSYTTADQALLSKSRDLSLNSMLSIHLIIKINIDIDIYEKIIKYY